jgi:hypothetical protein
VEKGFLMEIFARIAEEKIREAMKNGDFESLPGYGKPLRLEDDSQVPSDLRLAYKILKNAGYVPEELELRKQISTTRDLLACCTDEKEKYQQIQKLNLLITRMNMRRRIPVNLEENQVYYEKVVDKVKIKTKK